ncbi:hypothetical protein C8R46DRAFT_1109801 [Mycena filopes]|nr:hypothetical protein C8R46DRAFT_1109801 [Mycena filopes]
MVSHQQATSHRHGASCSRPPQSPHFFGSLVFCFTGVLDPSRIYLGAGRRGYRFVRARRRMEENSYPGPASSRTSGRNVLLGPSARRASSFPGEPRFLRLACIHVLLFADYSCKPTTRVSICESASTDGGELLPVPCVVKNLRYNFPAVVVFVLGVLEHWANRDGCCTGHVGVLSMGAWANRGGFWDCLYRG